MDKIGRNSSVIVVDDDPALLKMLQEGLSLEDYECDISSNAAAALTLINKNSYDLMITDVMLSDMNGFELIKRAKVSNPGMEVIIMTGFIDKFSYDEAIEAGASDFIKKPFTLQELLVRMKHVKMREELFDREKELKKKVKELEEFYDLAVGRELRMKKLKEEIDSLKKELEGLKKQ